MRRAVPEKALAHLGIRAGGAAQQTHAARDGDVRSRRGRASVGRRARPRRHRRARGVRARVVKEPAGFLEHQLQLHQLGVRLTQLLGVGGDLAELVLELLQPRLELVQVVRTVLGVRAGHGDEPGFVHLLGEVAHLAEHLVAPLHLVGVRALERGPVGVQISKLHQPNLAERGDGIVRRLGGHDHLHQLHRLRPEKLHRVALVGRPGRSRTSGKAAAHAARTASLRARARDLALKSTHGFFLQFTYVFAQTKCSYVLREKCGLIRQGKTLEGIVGNVKTKFPHVCS